MARIGFSENASESRTDAEKFAPKAFGAELPTRSENGFHLSI